MCDKHYWQKELKFNLKKYMNNTNDPPKKTTSSSNQPQKIATCPIYNNKKNKLNDTHAPARQKKNMLHAEYVTGKTIDGIH